MKRRWWKEGVVYQIYPRSFYDTNGDGIGDLRGIIKKLDYLKELGITIIWLNPVYKSPNDDNGYDISDYQNIMDEFGTLDDLQNLISELHKRGLKLIMDLVVNHTSDEHLWFIRSRSSKQSPFRDYYIWRSGKNGRKPNNWKSFFGGSAWEKDKATDEYYLHLFTKKQPDLNWENPEVRDKVYKMMKWWLDKGIDGFRMDCINMISKEAGLPDTDECDSRKTLRTRPFINGPRVHEFLQEMNTKVLAGYDIMTVGECAGVTTEDAMKYAGEDRHELDMIFQFELVELDFGPEGKWDIGQWKLPDFKNVISRWQKALHGKAWNSNYLMNHDQPRALSRFGHDGKYRRESAKLLATLLLTLEGTPYIYQGEEVGMTNIAFDSINDYRDVATLNFYQEAVGNSMDKKRVMEAIHYRSRDNSRTPMQWDSSENAGFTKGNPWIKVNPNYKQINISEALKDPDSIFYYYKRMIELRKHNPCLVYGDYTLLKDEDENIYVYLRTYGKERFLVILNFSDNISFLKLTEPGSHAEFIIGNYEVSVKTGIDKKMRPYEARVYRL